MDKALYFLALIPPDPLGQELNKLKSELSQQYHTFSALKSPSHITVLPPLRLGQEQREKLAVLVSAATVAQPTFLVQLKDYNCFGERTLYVGVETNEELKQLQEKLTFLAQELDAYQKSFHVFIPHLTLVNRDITPENFQRAWQEFSQRKFEAAFEARSLFMLELKRECWEVVKEFCFGGLGIR